jgi:hypothetical protein
MKGCCWSPLASHQDGKEHLLSFSTLQHSRHILTFPPKVTFLEPLAGVVAVMASLAEASAILLIFGTDVGGAIWRMGASGVGGIMAGDDFAFKGAFWPASFLCLCINVRLEKVKVKVKVKVEET